MKKIFVVIFTVFSGLSFIQDSFGEASDLKTSLNLIAESVAQKNFPKAIKELEWINVELQKGHKAALKSQLPPSILEFKIVEPVASAGEDFDMYKIKPKRIFSSSVYWASSIQHYRSESDQNLVIAFADNWNAQSRGVYQQKCSLDILKTTEFETMRIQGRIASVQRSEHPGINDIMTICLKDGLVAVEANQKEVTARFRDIANALKLEGLEKYLSGIN
jgi:hypothetical protein